MRSGTRLSKLSFSGDNYQFAAQSWCLSTAGQAYGSLCLFEKTLCIDCPNAIIDERHIGVWREIERQQIEVLACADLGAGGRQRAERFLAGARAVLSRLQPEGQEVAQ